MSKSRSNGLTQLFRLVNSDGTPSEATSLSAIVRVEPRYDDKVGGHIILWNDITAAFKDPLHIRDGDSIVPFIVDKNFEFLKPLRIAARPGVVLDVVLDASGKSSEKTSEVESLKISDSPPHSSSSSSRTAARSSQSRSSRDRSRSRSAVPNPPKQSRSTTSTKQHPPMDSLSNDLFLLNLQDPRQNKPETFGNPLTLKSGKMAIDSRNAFDDVVGNMTVDHNDYYRQGLIFYRGKGATVNYQKALDCFQEAAKQGHIPAHLYLGFMYENAIGVAQDNDAAQEWYITAGYRGFDDDPRNANSGIVRGSTQSHKKALQWYGDAAEKGDSRAQCKLGFIFQHGLGRLRNRAKALEWYEKAANQGYDNAQNSIGLLFYGANSASKDYSEAMEWFLRAALQGHARAQCNVGIMYQLGHGVTKNLNKAIEWYKKAASNGNDTARTNLENLRKQGYGRQ
ncbi:hypothetical protein BGZ46_007796 [Entomortierella lignicola]|nr:hypothetical protein BGZ46_007796 [Entomortierella lignicola]